MEQKIKMKATSRSIKILNRSVRGHSKRISACLVGKPKDPGGDTGEAGPRRTAEGEALAAGKRTAALGSRSVRGTVRRLGRKDAEEVAEAREERSHARTTGRRGPRIPTAACRGVGAAGVHSDGRREALAPSGAPRLVRGRSDRDGVPVSQSGRGRRRGRPPPPSAQEPSPPAGRGAPPPDGPPAPRAGRRSATRGWPRPRPARRWRPSRPSARLRSGSW